METPDEWPFEIQESYDPIRILGTGGFASVVLARHKTSNNATGTGNFTATANDIDTGIQKNKVAIKIVGCIHKDGNGNSNGLHLTQSHLKQQRDRAVLYARREIEILKHVHHPNIVRLFHHWIRDENDNDNDNHGRSENKKAPSRTQTQSLTAAVLVLEYARGPTVESLLKHGGALSTNFGRIVIAQTMNAIAYLHCHAVLHRDIKPDNILVAGALSSDDFVWDNEKDTEDKFSDIGIDGGRRHNHPAPNWKALRSKYKVTLIDFGFARALTPNDISKPSIETKRTDSELASYHRISNDRAYKGGAENDELGSSHHSTKSSRVRNRILKGVLDSSFHRLVNRSNHKNTPTTTRDELSNSLSHKLKRTMSALGNLNFAAPEIVHKVRPRFRPRTELPIKRPEQTPRGQTSTTETISNYVADYGLLVDSYSMGHTIRYMMTGVRPGISIEDAIWQQQRGVWVKKLCSLCRGRRNSAKRKQTRSVRIRSMEDLPGDIYRLVGALTQLAEEHRISIRKARWNVPWIADVLASQEQEQEPCPPTAPPLASQSQSQSQSQSLTQTPRIKRENDEQKEETALSQAPEEDPFRSNFYHISYLPFASIPPSKKPVARESESNVTKATTALIEHDGCSADDDVSPVDSTESETTLTF